MKYVHASITLYQEWGDDKPEYLEITVGHETHRVRVWGYDDVKHLEAIGVPVEKRE